MCIRIYVFFSFFFLVCIEIKDLKADCRTLSHLTTASSKKDYFKEMAFELRIPLVECFFV